MIPVRGLRSIATAFRASLLVKLFPTQQGDLITSIYLGLRMASSFIALQRRLNILDLLMRDAPFVAILI